MKKTCSVVLLCFLLLFLVQKVHCQRKNEIGIDFTNELAPGNNFRPGTGITYDYYLLDNHAIELGVFYRTFVHGFELWIENGWVSFEVKEKHLSFPLLYKFSSKVVNVYAGPTFELFMDWKQKSFSSPGFKLDSYTINPAYNVGMMLKIGKDIRLNEKLVFEPALRINHILNLERTYLGFGLNLKYVFFTQDI